MNKVAETLAQRFQEVMLNGKWIAFTNVKEQLEKTTLVEANTKIANLNTIAALAFHLNYYIEGLVSVLKGGPLSISDKASFNLTPMKTEKEWDELKSTLSENSKKMVTLIQGLSAEKLVETFFDTKYGNYERNITGLTEHGYYHLGQIVIIRKMIAEQNKA